MPAKAKKQAMPVTMKGALSTGPEKVTPAAFLLLLGVAVAVDEPDPGVASPELVAPSPLPAFCEPSPVRPGPFPAPFEKYYLSSQPACSCTNKQILGDAYSFGSIRQSREQSGVHEPVRVLSRARLRGGGRHETAAAGRGGVLLEGGLKLGKVGLLGGVAARDLDDAEAVGLQGVLVQETARVDARHLVRHEGADLAEVAAGGGAAVLGEEDGEAVAGEVLDLLVPAGGREIAVAPGVVVL